MQFKVDDKIYDNNLSYNTYLDDKYSDVKIAENTYFTSKALFMTDIDNYNDLFQEYLAEYPNDIYEKVKNYFPTPIAYTFNQYKTNYENQNQKLTLLRDISEISIYLLFAIIISKLINDNIDLKSITWVKRYKERVMAWQIWIKINVLESILKWYKLEISYNNDILDNLLNDDIVKNLNELNELRNKFSHTITLDESQSEEWIRKKEPLLVDLLDNLSYLENIKFCNYSNWKDLENHVINTFVWYSRDIEKEDIFINNWRVWEFKDFLNKKTFFFILGDEYILLTPFVYYIKEWRDQKICFYKKTENNKLKFWIIWELKDQEFEENDFINQIDLIKSLTA